MRYLTAAVLIVAASSALPAGTPASKAPAEVCQVVRSVVPLANLPEASGVAVSRRSPDRLWAHNDSGNPVLFALDTSGTVKYPVRVRGAQIRDWEDIASANCADGPCLYIADIGDNHADRRDITVYRVSEPADGEAATKPAQAIRATYPDGAHDAEAFFVTRSGEMFLVTKEHPPSLYRLVAPPNSPGSAGTLEKIKTLQEFGGKITGAGASVDDRWVALRTHAAVFVFSQVDLISPHASEPIRIDVSGLGEPQGEGVAFGPGGIVYLVGEGGGHHRPGTFASLRCTLR